MASESHSFDAAPMHSTPLPNAAEQGLHAAKRTVGFVTAVVGRAASEIARQNITGVHYSLRASLGGLLLPASPGAASSREDAASYIASPAESTATRNSSSSSGAGDDGAAGDPIRGLEPKAAVKFLLDKVRALEVELQNTRAAAGVAADTAAAGFSTAQAVADTALARTGRALAEAVTFRASESVALQARVAELTEMLEGASARLQEADAASHGAAQAPAQPDGGAVLGEAGSLELREAPSSPLAGPEESELAHAPSTPWGQPVTHQHGLGASAADAGAPSEIADFASAVLASNSELLGAVANLQGRLAELELQVEGFQGYAARLEAALVGLGYEHVARAAADETAAQMAARGLGAYGEGAAAAAADEMAYGEPQHNTPGCEPQQQPVGVSEDGLMPVSMGATAAAEGTYAAAPLDVTSASGSAGVVSPGQADGAAGASPGARSYAYSPRPVLGGGDSALRSPSAGPAATPFSAAAGNTLALISPMPSVAGGSSLGSPSLLYAPLGQLPGGVASALKGPNGALASPPAASRVYFGNIAVGASPVTPGAPAASMAKATTPQAGRRAAATSVLKAGYAAGSFAGVGASPAASVAGASPGNAAPADAPDAGAGFDAGTVLQVTSGVAQLVPKLDVLLAAMQRGAVHVPRAAAAAPKRGSGPHTPASLGEFAHMMFTTECDDSEAAGAASGTPGTGRHTRRRAEAVAAVSQPPGDSDVPADSDVADALSTCKAALVTQHNLLLAVATALAQAQADAACLAHEAACERGVVATLQESNSRLVAECAALTRMAQDADSDAVHWCGVATGLAAQLRAAHAERDAVRLHTSATATALMPSLLAQATARAEAAEQVIAQAILSQTEHLEQEAGHGGSSSSGGRGNTTTTANLAANGRFDSPGLAGALMFVDASELQSPAHAAAAVLALASPTAEALVSIHAQATEEVEAGAWAATLDAPPAPAVDAPAPESPLREVPISPAAPSTAGPARTPGVAAQASATGPSMIAAPGSVRTPAITAPSPAGSLLFLSPASLRVAARSGVLSASGALRIAPGSAASGGGDALLSPGMRASSRMTSTGPGGAGSGVPEALTPSFLSYRRVGGDGEGEPTAPASALGGTGRFVTTATGPAAAQSPSAISTPRSAASYATVTMGGRGADGLITLSFSTPPARMVDAAVATLRTIQSGVTAKILAGATGTPALRHNTMRQLAALNSAARYGLSSGAPGSASSGLGLNSTAGCGSVDLGIGSAQSRRSLPMGEEGGVGSYRYTDAEDRQSSAQGAYDGAMPDAPSFSSPQPAQQMASSSVSSRLDETLPASATAGVGGLVSPASYGSLTRRVNESISGGLASPPTPAAYSRLMSSVADHAASGLLSDRGSVGSLSSPTGSSLGCSLRLGSEEDSGVVDMGATVRSVGAGALAGLFSPLPAATAFTAADTTPKTPKVGSSETSAALQLEIPSQEAECPASQLDGPSTPAAAAPPLTPVAPASAALLLASPPPRALGGAAGFLSPISHHRGEGRALPTRRGSVGVFSPSRDRALAPQVHALELQLALARAEGVGAESGSSALALDHEGTMPSQSPDSSVFGASMLHRSGGASTASVIRTVLTRYGGHSALVHRLGAAEEDAPSTAGHLRAGLPMPKGSLKPVSFHHHAPSAAVVAGADTPRRALAGRTASHPAGLMSATGRRYSYAGHGAETTFGGAGGLNTSAAVADSVRVRGFSFAGGGAGHEESASGRGRSASHAPAPPRAPGSLSACASTADLRRIDSTMSLGLSSHLSGACDSEAVGTDCHLEQSAEARLHECLQAAGSGSAADVLLAARTPAPKAHSSGRVAAGAGWTSSRELEAVIASNSLAAHGALGTSCPADCSLRRASSMLSLFGRGRSASTADGAAAPLCGGCDGEVGAQHAHCSACSGVYCAQCVGAANATGHAADSVAAELGILEAPLHATLHRAVLVARNPAGATTGAALLPAAPAAAAATGKARGVPTGSSRYGAQGPVAGPAGLVALGSREPSAAAAQLLPAGASVERVCGTCTSTLAFTSPVRGAVVGREEGGASME